MISQSRVAMVSAGHPGSMGGLLSIIIISNDDTGQRSAPRPSGPSDPLVARRRPDARLGDRAAAWNPVGPGVRGRTGFHPIPRCAGWKRPAGSARRWPCPRRDGGRGSTRSPPPDGGSSRRNATNGSTSPRRSSECWTPFRRCRARHSFAGSGCCSVAGGRSANSPRRWNSTSSCSKHSSWSRGWDPREARRRARIAFVSRESFRAEARDAPGFVRTRALLADAHHAVRALCRNPGFALVAVATLALGIGATIAIFSVLSAMLLRPVPFPDGHRVVSLAWNHGDYVSPSLSSAKFAYWREHTRSFAAIGSWRPFFGRVGEAGEITGAQGLRVTDGFLPRPRHPARRGPRLFGRRAPLRRSPGRAGIPGLLAEALRRVGGCVRPRLDQG